MQKERLELLDLVAGNTLNYRQKEWLDNFFANLDDIRGSYGVISLSDTLVDVPAILVGSGPTLNYNIDQLVGLNSRACIICGSSSLHGLLEAGVKPHLVMVTDSKERCIEYLEGADLSEITVIVDTFAHPVVVKKLLEEARRVYWYNTLEMERLSFTRILDDYTGFVGKISTGGCGITTGWCLARNLLGCDPDVLVGLPEAFYDPGSPYDAGSAEQYSRLLTKHHKVENYTSENIETTDAYGRLCHTKAGFQSFAWWFFQAFVDVPGIHINCSEGGILKENCLSMSLAFCGGKYLRAKYDIESRLFTHERKAAEVVDGLQLPEDHMPLLTWLVGGPSLPTLALRMGWPQKEVEKEITYLQGLGVKIRVSPYTAQDTAGNRISTEMYMLEGYDESIGCDMREEREPEVSGEEPSGD